MTLKEQFARARHPLLFLALLIQPVGGQLATAQEEPTPDYALIIDVYSGAVLPDATQEKTFWLWLETLKKTEEPRWAAKSHPYRTCVVGERLRYCRTGRGK